MAKNRSMTVSWASSEHTRRSMLGNRSRDTLPELAVRRLVHAAGLRYRVDYPPLRDRRRLRADIVFTRAKVAVFIDGPHHDSDTQQQRDREAEARLTNACWFVIRFQHDDDWAALADQNEWLFGRGRSTT